jgi:hypothetical protein
MITKEHAEKTAAKLGAIRQTKQNRPHELCTIYHGRQVIARFGIRRGSSKNLGHDFIPGQIHVSPHDARLLADCQLTREWWIEHAAAGSVVGSEFVKATPLTWAAIRCKLRPFTVKSRAEA